MPSICVSYRTKLAPRPRANQGPVASPRAPPWTCAPPLHRTCPPPSPPPAAADNRPGKSTAGLKAVRPGPQPDAHKVKSAEAKSELKSLMHMSSDVFILENKHNILYKKNK